MHGNIGDGEHMKRVKAEAERAINEIVMGSGPIIAEINEESRAGWYMAQTYAGDERRALRHLARRRFACFLAMKPKDDEGFGAERTVPGWILVYVFDIDKMLDRLLGAPGVVSILRDPLTSRPMVIDEDFIHTAIDANTRIRYRQPVKVPVNPQKAAGPGRPKPRERRMLDELKKALKQAGITYSDEQWAFINGLVPRVRIAVLRTALRASTASPSGSA